MKRNGNVQEGLGAFQPLFSFLSYGWSDWRTKSTRAIIWRMTLLKRGVFALHDCLNSDTWKVSLKTGFLLQEMEVLHPQFKWWGVVKRENVLHRSRMYALQNNFVSQGVYVLSFAEQFSLHMDAERNIERRWSTLYLHMYILGLHLNHPMQNTGVVRYKELYSEHLPDFWSVLSSQNACILRCSWHSYTITPRAGPQTTFSSEDVSFSNERPCSGSRYIFYPVWLRIGNLTRTWGQLNSAAGEGCYIFQMMSNGP